MSDSKFRVALRERPIFGKDEEERVVEFNSISDLVERIQNPNELYLYLGIYKLGQVVSFTEETIGFEGFLAGTLNFYMEFSPIHISKELLGRVCNCEFTLEEFLKIIWSDCDFETELVDEPNRAWELLQNHWIACGNVKEIINPNLADEETISKEHRILFWE